MTRFLPVNHPDFQYPRSRNPYYEKIHDDSGGLIFSEHGTEKHRGEWLKMFPAKSLPGTSLNDLHVEIGCNGGHVILEWAAKRPAEAFIGIDWKFKQIFRAAEKASERNLKNLLLFRAHASRLSYMFRKSEIDHLYLFFPDPWPKKSQWKNRWVNPENLRAAAETVKPGGSFWIKTDHDGYFEWMKDALAEVSDVWETLELTHDLHSAHPEPTRLVPPDVTLFERLFIRDGIKIKSVRLRRTGAPAQR